MITDDRIAELKRYAVHYPGTFYKVILSEDVLGLITRVETAEERCGEIAAAHVARGNAGAVNVARWPSQATCDAVAEQMAAQPVLTDAGMELDDGLIADVATMADVAFAVAEQIIGAYVEGRSRIAQPNRYANFIEACTRGILEAIADPQWDPNDDAADGGVTAMMVIRKEAQQVLAALEVL